jgi:urease accessory protein
MDGSLALIHARLNDAFTSAASPKQTTHAMQTVNKLLPQGHGLSPVILKRAAAVVLDWDTRQKSRFDTEDSQGRHLGVFLPRGTVVRGGDVLVTEDGSLVKVIATPQPVMVVRHCGKDGSPHDLLRAAYHLGNRHVQLELQADALMLEPDHVLAAMLRQMHLVVTDELAPFEPEAGAYAESHAHAGEHDHGHDHDHAAAPRKAIPIAVAPATAAPAPAPHVHGPGCGHHH